MDEITLKGFKFINGTAEGFNLSALEANYIYFIRTDADKTDGYVYFNGKSYGTAKNIEATVQALTETIGAFPEGKTVAEAIADAQSAATYDDSTISNALGTLSGRVDTLVGDTENEGKSVKDIAIAALTEVLTKDAVDDSMDSLEEIAAWIQAHPVDAAAMNKSIANLQESVEDFQKIISGFTSASTIADAVNAKADAEHTHEIADVDGLQDALDGKSDTGHTHVMADITDLDLGDMKTTKDITVAGLSEALGTGVIDNGYTITAGTSLQSFLEQLLVKEIYPTPAVSSSAFTVTFTNPSFVVKNGTTSVSSSANIEVGTELTFSTVSGTNRASQSYSITGFTYGYKESLDGNVVSSTTYTAAVSPTRKNESDYSNLTATFTGFGATAISNVTSIPETTLTVASGSNTIKLNGSGNTYVSQEVSDKTLYVVSNIGNTSEDNTIVASYASSEKTGTDTDTFTVKGCYKYFIGESNISTLDELTSDAVRSLTWKSGLCTLNSISVISSITTTNNSTSKKYLLFALPSGYSVKELVGSLNNSMLTAVQTLGNMTVKCGTAEVDGTYTIYMLESNTGLGITKLTIGK